jgi:hypothetical protein
LNSIKQTWNEKTQGGEHYIDLMNKETIKLQVFKRYLEERGVTVSEMILIYDCIYALVDRVFIEHLTRPVGKYFRAYFIFYDNEDAWKDLLKLFEGSSSVRAKI